MVGLRKWLGFLGLALLLGLLGAGPAAACPFCSLQGKTLTGEVEQANMVLFGTLQNANEGREETEIKIDSVIKDDSIRAGKTTLILKKYIPPAMDGKEYKYLVFCEVFKGNIDPYRGVAVTPDSKIAEYLKGAVNQKGKTVGQRLRFFFDYLDNDDLEISNDSYKEFANADYKDYKDMAHDLPADRLVKWLKSDSTPGFRIGLYASMLGHCGKQKDAEVLRALLNNPARQAASGVDGLMAGYVMLQPKEGWKYLEESLKDTKKEFMFRYAALRAVRFLHDFTPDVVAKGAISKKELIDAVCLVLPQADMADLAIEDLRKWQQWDRADRVLGVLGTPAAKESVVPRSILRYCLQCKGSATASAYVAERRKADPEGVQDVEELLKLEVPADTPGKK